LLFNPCGVGYGIGNALLFKTEEFRLQCSLEQVNVRRRYDHKRTLHRQTVQGSSRATSSWLLSLAPKKVTSKRNLENIEKGCLRNISYQLSQ
jgi:hypothetical protein